jgi:hypothetical protein
MSFARIAPAKAPGGYGLQLARTGVNQKKMV